jgi:hypothetical protein
MIICWGTVAGAGIDGDAGSDSFIGPKAEAEEIKAKLAAFLREELDPDKTLITHGRAGPARFLGYQITSSTVTRNSPGAAGRSTGGSRCGCRGT